MMRKLVIAALPAVLAVGHAGEASAWVVINGGGTNGVHINGIKQNGGGSNGTHVNGIRQNGTGDNGGGANGTHMNGIFQNGTGDNGQGTQGTSPTGSAGAIVISIELPAPAAR